MATSIELPSCFPCPALDTTVECTAERLRHIAEHHPDLLPAHRDSIAATLADPDTVRASRRMPAARLLTRWFDDLRGGKFVVVIVVLPGSAESRAWLMTAYMARSLAPGDILWTRPA